MEPENPEAAKTMNRADRDRQQQENFRGGGNDPIGDFHRSAFSVRSDLIAGIRSVP
jgi:hypothetical protein